MVAILSLPATQGKQLPTNLQLPTNSSFVWELKEKRNQTNYKEWKIPNLLHGQPGIEPDNLEFSKDQKKKREVTLTKVPIKATDAPVQTQQHTP